MTPQGLSSYLLFMSVRERLKQQGKRDRPSRREAPRLTPKLRKQFCTLIGRGLPMDGCCDYLSVSPSHFREWLRKGENYIHGNHEPKNHQKFGRFYLALRKAHAAYRLKILGKLHEGEKNWTCWMTVLERRDRTSFSRYDSGGTELDDYDPDERFL